MNSWVSRHTPKLWTCLREGYTLRHFAGDLSAGLTVAVIALPLAMALGIASIPQNVADELASVHPWLTPPAMGLFTAVIAGTLISGLGGSRFQIGGPTAAFMPLVFGICAAHGYDGLVLATIMAGIILILLGVFRFGDLVVAHIHLGQRGPGEEVVGLQRGGHEAGTDGLLHLPIAQQGHAKGVPALEKIRLQGHALAVERDGLWQFPECDVTARVIEEGFDFGVGGDGVAHAGRRGLEQGARSRE